MNKNCCSTTDGLNVNDFEIAKIEKTKKICPMCEDFAAEQIKNQSNNNFSKNLFGINEVNEQQINEFTQSAAAKIVGKINLSLFEYEENY